MRLILGVIILLSSLFAHAFANSNDVSELFERGKIDAAEEQVERWVESEQDNAEAWYWQGIVFAHQASHSFFSAYHYALGSLEGFERAVQLDPNNPKYIKGLLEYYKSAPAIVGGGEDKAWELIEEKLKTAEAIADDLFIEAGLLAQQQQQFELSQRYFKQAANSEKRVIRLLALYQLGRTSVFSGRDLALGIGALKNYMQAWLPSDQKLNLPESHWARWRISQLYDLMGVPDKAADYRKNLSAVEDDALQASMEGWMEN